jgi:hypothetical protein
LLPNPKNKRSGSSSLADHNIIEGVTRLSSTAAAQQQQQQQRKSDNNYNNSPQALSLSRALAAVDHLLAALLLLLQLLRSYLFESDGTHRTPPPRPAHHLLPRSRQDGIKLYNIYIDDSSLVIL